MKIAIIGGGWVGCHLAHKLMGNHSITIFEQNDKLFQETSFNNQNRLHYGFHYPRNHKTRILCKSTFDLFLKDYNFAVEDVEKNIYAIPNNKSLIDYESYKKIFSDYDFLEIKCPIDNVEGCINTKEKYINFKLVNNFFNKELSHLVIHKKIKNEKLKNLSKKYDLVLNTSNNHLNTYEKSHFELTVSFIYEKIKNTNFDSLTLMDGKFFSIYPYNKNEYTVTDVEFTPIKTFKDINDLENYKKLLKEDEIKNRSLLIEEKIKYYFPEFLNHFKYITYFLSTKTKIYDESDDRSPIIFKENNVINCFTGKIQGIYNIEKYVKNEIDNW